MPWAPADVNSCLRPFIWHRTKVSKVLRARNLQSWLDLLQYSAVLLYHSQTQAFVSSFYSFSPSKLLLSFKYFQILSAMKYMEFFASAFQSQFTLLLAEWGARAKASSVYLCAQNEAWDGMAWTKTSLKCSLLAILFLNHCAPIYSYNQIIIITLDI